MFIDETGASIKMARLLAAISPDLNPIELAFAKLKAMLRKIAARTIDGLLGVIAENIEKFTAEECRNYFAAAEYYQD